MTNVHVIARFSAGIFAFLSLVSHHRSLLQNGQSHLSEISVWVFLQRRVCLKHFPLGSRLVNQSLLCQ